MVELNRILLQLNRAVDCSNSSYPQDRGMAVILFDNLIEVQLYKRAEKTLTWDETTWYNGKRKFNKDTRKYTVSKDGKYDNLLKFSKDNGIIGEKDFEILKYIHSIRNEVYHRGELDNLKLDLAIITYFGFLTKSLKKWRSPSGLLCFPGSYPGSGSEEIDFGQGLSNSGIKFDFYNYYNTSLDLIFTKLKYKNKLADQATHIVTEQMKRVRFAIEYITKEAKSINFYDVLGRYWYLNGDFFEFYAQKRKPKNLDSILILYSFLRKYKNDLDDIPDLKERQKKGRRQLKIYRKECKGKYPHWTNLDKIDERVNNFKNKDEHTVMKNLMDIEVKLSKLYSDTEEASSDLDGYTNDKRG